MTSNSSSTLHLPFYGLWLSSKRTRESSTIEYPQPTSSKEQQIILAIGGGVLVTDFKPSDDEAVDDHSFRTRKASDDRWSRRRIPKAERTIGKSRWRISSLWGRREKTIATLESWVVAIPTTIIMSLHTSSLLLLLCTTLIFGHLFCK